MDQKKPDSPTDYEVVIIGGGINGAGLLRDLSLNGVKTLLIEKGDFASQTSQNSSKMLHGGIRYLEHLDFALIQEALEEKNLWLKLTPHLCFEQAFYLPLYHYSKYSPWMLRFGLMAYDFLSHFQNRPYSMLSPRETIQELPSLDPKQLSGCGKYYDGIVDDAKLALECIYDALLSPGVKALNYHEVLGVNSLQGRDEVVVKDLFSGHIKKFTTQFLVFTTGPFTDELLPKLKIPWQSQLLPSKGIHLWLDSKALSLSGPVVLTTRDNRVVFVIPQREAILVGTTETPVEEDMFNIKATQKEILYLLGALKQYFPQSQLSESSIISTFAGIRPLVKDQSGGLDRGSVSRHHKIFRPTARSYVLLGGKYTTFRKMTQELAWQIVPRLSRPYYPNLTLNPLRQFSVMGTFGETKKLNMELIKKIIQTEGVKTFEDLITRRLSLIQRPGDLTHVMGVPLKELKEAFF